MSQQQDKQQNRNSSALIIAALGVVFGDIGTSPLYAIREAFHGPHAIEVNQANVYGVLSLIIWTLTFIVSLKYLMFVTRAHNKGEGGVMALTALVAGPRQEKLLGWRYRFLLIGLFGAALLIGEGVLTPAITVLSAIEGLEVATPMFAPYVVPISILIIILLFLAQKFGTAKIGSIFGPIIMIWFIVIAILGLKGIWIHPEILHALNPYYAIQFLFAFGSKALPVLGAVFLVVTGTEALYADMGHFGISPIKKAWFALVFPSLIINYLGQSALILSDSSHAVNPFFKLCPDWALYPMVGLAALAAIIASQALISGVFSLVRQAIQLGYAPRMRIIHTSGEEIGQIYVPNVNWALMVLTIWVVLEFKTSSSLAGAYGLGVSLTMVISTFLACAVAHQIWKWNIFVVTSILIFLLAIDFTFLSANMLKIGDGGWFPIALGLSAFALMTTWKKGRHILMAKLREQSIPFDEFIEKITHSQPFRTKGTAVFMTGDANGTPPALLHNLKHNHVVHEKVALLTILTTEEPYVPKSERLKTEDLGHGFYRIKSFHGFMESPDINEILSACEGRGISFCRNEITYFLGRETLFPAKKPSMPLWRELLFSFMSRNAERATSYYNIPSDQVIEIGIQIHI